MRVYHGTWEKKEISSPTFVTPSFDFAKWFAETAVDEKEEYFVWEYQLKDVNKLNDLDISMPFTDPQNTWKQIEDNNDLLSLLREQYIGVWMTEKGSPTIMLFKPEIHLKCIGKHSFIKTILIEEYTPNLQVLAVFDSVYINRMRHKFKYFKNKFISKFDNKTY